MPKRYTMIFKNVFGLQNIGNGASPTRLFTRSLGSSDLMFTFILCMYYIMFTFIHDHVYC